MFANIPTSFTGEMFRKLTFLELSRNLPLNASVPNLI